MKEKHNKLVGVKVLPATHARLKEIATSKSTTVSKMLRKYFADTIENNELTKIINI